MQTLTKGMLVTNVLLAAGNAGQIAWSLSRADGDSIPGAIRYGCGAFVTTVFVLCALIGLWYALQNREP